jgi:putative ABC transport system permease protein
MVAAALLSVLGAVALVLAALGLYSVLAFAVGQREHEFGIRMVLGAQSAEVLRLVVRQRMLLTLVCLVAERILSLMAARLIAGLLVNVSARNLLLLAEVGLFLALAALLASYLPVRHATRVDPCASRRQQ